jgi:hypothetical protein
VIFAYTEARSGGVKPTRRRLGIAPLVDVVAGGLVAATATGARARAACATVYTPSVGSGELKSGRLKLRGVSRRLTWATSSGRSGVVSVKRLHRSEYG